MTGVTSFTNLAWPEDPYRTGQQLYRKPGPVLAAFTLAPDIPAWARRQPLVSAAVVYLPLRRTGTVTVTGPELAFGFRAITATDRAGVRDLARAVDLDLARARRHAAVLAGLSMAADLLRLLAGNGAGPVLRGTGAVLDDWAGREVPARGTALMVDCDLDLPAATPEEACEQARVSPGAGWEQVEPGELADVELAAAATTRRALMVALLAGRHLGRVSWERDLDLTEIITANGWDQFPRLRPGATGDRAMAAARAGGPGAS